jgi:hypothetical protein
MAKQNTSFPHSFAAFCIFCCYPLPLVGIGTACQYHVRMRLLGNILWLILGGLLLAASWAIIGLVLCITIVGIPLGIQAFKMAGLTLTPFGKTVEYGGGVGSVLLNIIWFVDGNRLCVRRATQLHYHYWYSVRHSIIQDGQAGLVAVRFANSRVMVGVFECWHPHTFPACLR